jgi:hypothetical protein
VSVSSSQILNLWQGEQNIRQSTFLRLFRHWKFSSEDCFFLFMETHISDEVCIIFTSHNFCFIRTYGRRLLRYGTVCHLKYLFAKTLTRVNVIIWTMLVCGALDVCGCYRGYWILYSFQRLLWMADELIDDFLTSRCLHPLSAVSTRFSSSGLITAALRWSEITERDALDRRTRYTSINRVVRSQFFQNRRSK